MMVLKAFSTRTGGDDVIGQIQVKPVEWQYRRKVTCAIIDELQNRPQISSLVLKSNISFRMLEAASPITMVIELSGNNAQELELAAKTVRHWADSNAAFTNISDSSSKTMYRLAD